MSLTLTELNINRLLYILVQRPRSSMHYKYKEIMDLIKHNNQLKIIGDELLAHFPIKKSPSE